MWYSLSWTAEGGKKFPRFVKKEGRPLQGRGRPFRGFLLRRAGLLRIFVRTAGIQLGDGGGYAPEKLTGFYRAMMAPMARLVSRAPAETEADRAMRDAFRDGGDWVSPERLAPVLAWLDGD